jgi:hypothetical protein
MGYGPFVVTIPPLEDSDLIYTEDETRTIFNYFYPSWSSDIEKCKIDNDGRAMAQTMILAAVDATYAMSYVETVMKFVAGQTKSASRDILKLVRKLGQKMTQNYLKHVKDKKELEHPKIYESVRVSVANNFNQYAGDYISGTRLLSMNLMQKGYRAHIAAG